MQAVKPQCCYRFACPNYSFPFEPHFCIPIIVNKRITYNFFRDKINKAPFDDAKGLWNSLNWLTVRKVRKLAKFNGYYSSFDRSIVKFYVERALRDKTFCDRHPTIHKLVRRLEKPTFFNFSISFPSVFPHYGLQNESRNKIMNDFIPFNRPYFEMKRVTKTNVKSSVNCLVMRIL